MGSILVRVVPRSSRNEIGGWDADGHLKVKLTAPPVDGAANEGLVRFLAKKLKVAPGTVSIKSGATSRNKLVKVEGWTDADLARSLTPSQDREKT